jgi:hypothetical protein
MPFRRRAKLTNPGAAVIVMALFSDALRFTLAVFEFSWALAFDGIRARTAAANARASPLYPKSLCLRASFR